MTIKFLMTWDIIQGREQEYFEFVIREFIPGIQQLGMEPTDAWFTVYGDQPQIMAVMKSQNLESLQTVLQTNEWEGLTNQLLDFVENFTHKAIEARAGFQI